LEVPANAFGMLSQIMSLTPPFLWKSFHWTDEKMASAYHHFFLPDDMKHGVPNKL
jgi:hypothetical protein